MTIHFGAEAYQPWMNTGARDLYDAADALRRAPYQRYTGQRVASFSPLQNMAMDEARARRDEYRPYLANAEQLLSGMGRPAHEGLADYLRSYQPAQELINLATRPSHNYIPAYMNRYQKDVIDKANSEILRNYREGIQPEIDNTFVRRGQHGSSRHRDISLRASQQAMQAIAENESGMRNKHYLEAANLANADQGRALSGASLLGRNYQEAATMRNADLMRSMAASGEMANLGTRLQGNNLANIGLLNTMGAQQQGREQHLLNNAYENFHRANNYPLEMVQHQSNILHGLPQSLLTSNLMQAPMQPQLDVPGQIGQLAFGLHGMMNRGLGRKAGGRIPMRRR